MGRDHPQTLTLERFASGKDGRANAFKKKKQANKRKLFEKAQLKRQYAKILKKEAHAGANGRDHQRSQGGSMTELKDEEQAVYYQQLTSADGSSRRNRRGRASPSEQLKRGQDDVGDVDTRGRDRRTLESDDKIKDAGGESEIHEKAKKKREGPRPDPFHEAKAKADQNRKEAEERQNDRDRQRREKEERAKKRRKQHTLLSKRTKGGQPVMKHTMQHLLERIKAQS